MLVADIKDFDYIVTSSELESLILEITLIKKYDPKYNIFYCGMIKRIRISNLRRRSILEYVSFGM